MTTCSGIATRLHRNLHNALGSVPPARTLRFPEGSVPIRRRFDDLKLPARGTYHMRRWLSARATGALLALMLVVASTATAFADPRDFQLANNSGRDIAEIYVTPSNMDDW